MAIGVAAFAFVALFALLPAGLSTFRVAMDTSVGAQITQRIVSDLQETDFQVLLTSATHKNRGTEAQYYRLPLRYFDDQGNETKSPSDATAVEKLKILYTARVRGSNPGKAKPSEHSSSYFTSLPDVSGKRFNPRDLTILTIQIVANPANRDVESLVDEDSFLILPDKARKAGMSLQTYSVALARNGYSTKTTP